MARVGRAFTGEDDETDSPLRNILSNEGPLKPILGDAASRSALLQIGLNLMQPPSMGQSTSGALGQAIGSGGEVEARLAKEDFERQKHEDELDKSQRTLDIRQQEANAYSQAQKAAAARGATTDKLALEQLRQQGRMQLHGAKDFAAKAKSEHDTVNAITFNPKNPAQADRVKFIGKTEKQIERMLREEDAAAGGGVQPSKGSQDEEARAWALENPNDPRAAKIRQRLGM